MRQGLSRRLAVLAIGLLAAAGGAVQASSHMDAPLITLDPAANTTDVYAFVTEDGGEKYLTVALGVYPHEEPGIGPNKYNFDDNVRYEIHVLLGQDVAEGETSLTYRWEFQTEFKNENTILQSYLGVIQDVDDAAQNLTQRYRVSRLEPGDRRGDALGFGVVPPNNQGIATPFYNQDDDGEKPAREGVSTLSELDRYTQQSIATLSDGYLAFAGQRDDGFFANIQAVFDLLQLGPDFDSQGGFNIHLLALRIPVEELGGDQQIAGVYATTSRRARSISSRDGSGDDDDDDDSRRQRGKFVQVGRQGNPLFNEALVAIADKDRYSRTSPDQDAELFLQYAESPELAALLNLLVVPGTGLQPAIETDRSDLAGIFIPDVIKVDLSTPAVPLAGNGPGAATSPDDPGFSPLSVFGGDVVPSTIQDPFGNGGFIPSGFPNGRRFGDDVIDIAVTAILSDLRTLPLFIQGPAGDGVDRNDIGYNKVFPYASTPLNGRNHEH